MAKRNCGMRNSGKKRRNRVRKHYVVKDIASAFAMCGTAPWYRQFEKKRY